MPSLAQAIAQVYRDLVQALSALRNLAVIAFVIILAADIVLATFIPDRDPQPSRRILFAFVLQCVRGFLLTPYLIAVHRFIILGETTTSYQLTPREPRFQMFFLWMLALEVVSTLPVFIIQWFPAASGARIWTVLVVTIAITITLLRLTLIFPAVAADSAGATFTNVMADTKGHVWRLFLVTSLAFAGIFVPVLILAKLIGTDGELSLTLLGAFNALASGVLGLVLLTLLVAIASRFYLWIGSRLKAP